MTNRAKFLVAFALVACSTIELRSQAIFATLTGVVSDPSQAVVPQATEPEAQPRIVGRFEPVPDHPEHGDDDRRRDPEQQQDEVSLGLAARLRGVEDRFAFT